MGVLGFISFVIIFVIIGILVCTIFFLAGILFSLFYGYWIGVPFVRSSKKKIRIMLELAGVEPGEIVVDLGSGDGSLLIAVAKKGARSYGAESNPLLVFSSRIKARFLGLRNSIHFDRKDIFSVSLRDADVLFLYLTPRVIEKLKEKFVGELKPGARIVSNTFPIPGWVPEKEKDGVFLYEKR